ncbi:MAG: hypothetical protein Q9201_000788 [Fulgogasparrea decipioides]
MAKSQLPSQDSSSTPSRSRFTPSETWLSPSESIADNSHLGARGDPGAYISSWSDFANETWSIIAGFEGVIDTDPALRGEPKSPPVSWMNEEGNNQNDWVAINQNQGDDQEQQANAASFDRICSFPWNPRIQLQPTDFDQPYLYGPVPGRQEYTAVTMPRWSPVVDDTIAGPWPPQFLFREEIYQDPCSASQLFEPAMEPQAAWLNDQDRHFGGDDGEELDLNCLQNPHAHPGQSAVPDENIDPPASPDPVGPPSQLSARTDCLNGKAPRTVTTRAQRHDPRTSRNRLNIKNINQPGQCWDCALQRNKVSFNHRKQDNAR